MKGIRYFAIVHFRQLYFILIEHKISIATTTQQFWQLQVPEPCSQHDSVDPSRHVSVSVPSPSDSLGSLLDGDRLALAAAPVSSGRDPSAVSFSSVPMPPQTDPQSPFYRRSRHAPLYTPNLESKYPAARLRRDRNRTMPDDVDTTQLEVRVVRIGRGIMGYWWPMF